MRTNGLRVALLAYRGNPHSGGQGVYVRHLSRSLVELGHSVDVYAGQPYPELDPGVGLVPLPSLDLYRHPDPFRVPALAEFRDWIDVVEYTAMCTAAFPEPLTFSLRAWRALASRAEDYDVVHDNQCLGYGLLGLRRAGLPVLATIHHPVAIDRALELAAAQTWRRRLSLRRWYAFARMQRRVAAHLPALVTVSAASRDDIARAMRLDPTDLHVVPNGVDPSAFRPRPDRARRPGRILTTASDDVPLKGLVHLLEALAKVRTERDADLVVVGRARPDGPAAQAIRRLDLTDAVHFAGQVSHERLVDLYAECELAAVPSVYEGFSLPAVEAMACGVPLVTTTGGALPEVVGADGDVALTVPAANPEALAAAIGRALDDPVLRAALGARGRRRALERFSWRRAAERTVVCYETVLRC